MRKTNLAAIAATFQLFNLSTIQPAVAAVESAEPVAIVAEAEQPVPYAAEIAAEAYTVPIVPLANECDAWYDRIEAKPGSRAYWIIYVARQTAKRGEDTSYLRRILNDTLAKWFSVPSAAAPGGEITPD